MVKGRKKKKNLRVSPKPHAKVFLHGGDMNNQHCKTLFFKECTLLSAYHLLM